MGRKTWESLPANVRPLPQRTNVVVTRQADYHVPSDVYVFPSLKEAMEAFADNEIVIIGGGEIYRQALSLTDTLYITHVNKEVEGDVTFPLIDPKIWVEKESEPHDGYVFTRYERR
jgi:dihydrofolate reductase